MELVAKIERVARIKGVAHDNRQRFNSGRERRGNFATELRRAMKKNEEPESAAYDLEITSCGTHSLFYSSGLSLEALLR